MYHIIEFLRRTQVAIFLAIVLVTVWIAGAERNLSSQVEEGYRLPPAEIPGGLRQDAQDESQEPVAIDDRH